MSSSIVDFTTIVLLIEEIMAFNSSPPSLSLINAAVQSLFPATVTAVGGAIANSMRGTLALNSINIVQSYHSSLVPSISVTGQCIPRQYLDGPLGIDTSCLDSKFDHDFTNMRDNVKIFRRGNEPYERPCGTYRIALKVKDKFGRNNNWLGMTGDEPGEWPVSYHGTAQHNALDIAQVGFKLSKGKRFLYGKGIYSTPELEVAKDYANSFVHEGTSYKCVIQNRVNPKYLKVLSKEETGVGIYWLSAADKYVNESELIRPYGLCLFKL